MPMNERNGVKIYTNYDFLTWRFDLENFITLCLCYSLRDYKTKYERTLSRKPRHVYHISDKLEPAISRATAKYGPLRSSSIDIVFHCGHLPLRSSYIEVVFH